MKRSLEWINEVKKMILIVCQKEFKSELSEILKVNPNFKSREKISAIKNIKRF